MANIQPQIDAIRTAKYGRDVRESIATGLEAMNTESSQAYNAAITAQNSASNSAQQAAQSATDADNARQAAAQSVSSAAGSASAALQSASNAAGSATNAAQSATNAQGYLNTVAQSAQQAIQAATNAGTAESNAQAAAQSAAQASTDAQTARTQAMQSATNAQTSASTASNSQTAASISATNAAQAAKEAQDAAKAAQAAANVEIATTVKPGLVMPDGTTISVDQYGRVSAAGVTQHVAALLASEQGVHGVRIYTDPTTNLITLQRWDEAAQKWIAVFTNLIPDGETIVMDEDGTLHGSATIDVDTELSETSENPVQNKIITTEIKTHKDSLVMSENGVHGLRYNDEKLEAKDEDGNWVEIETGGGESETDITFKMLGYTIPKEMPIQNYIGEDGKFHQRVGRVDLGSLSWGTLSRANYFRAILDGRTKQNDNGYCPTYNYKYSSLDDMQDKTINSADWLYIKDTSYSDVASITSALQGVYLYYELATEIVMPIDGNEASYKASKGVITNLLKPVSSDFAPSATAQCINNHDGTYTVNGTATGSYARFYFGNITIPKGKHLLVGSPIALSSGIRMDLYRTEGKWIGNKYLIDLETDITDQVIITIQESRTANNLLFKPMLTTDLSATYDDFVPYTGDTGSLNGDVAKLSNSIIYKKGDIISNENVSCFGYTNSNGYIRLMLALSKQISDDVSNIRFTGSANIYANGTSTTVDLSTYGFVKRVNGISIEKNETLTGSPKLQPIVMVCNSMSVYFE